MDRKSELLIALLLLVGAGWWYWQRGGVHSGSPPPAVAAVVPVPAAIGVSPQAALEASQQRFRLGLDRRMIRALAITARFPAEGRDAPVVTHYQGDGWALSVAGESVGSLPAYPDFDDALTVLRKLASGTVAKLKLQHRDATADEVARATSFDDTSLFTELLALDKASPIAGMSAADLTLAAEASTRLTFFEKDRTQASDEEYAKALSLLALAEAASGQTMPKEEGLLASAMGYSAAAARRVTMLPADDPWRQYMTRDDDALEHRARVDPDSHEANYLWLRRLADLDRKQDWAAWYKQRYATRLPTVEVAETVLGMEGQGPHVGGAAALFLTLLSELHAPSGLHSVDEVLGSPSTVVKSYQEGLVTAQSQATGPYLTAADLEAYYDGYLYTGLHAYCVYLLDEWARPQDAEQFRARLAGAQSPGAQELYVWYGDKIGAEQGGRSLASVTQDMKAAHVLGAGLYDDAVTLLIQRLDAGGPETRAAVQAIATAYDTRRELREEYAEHLGDALDLADQEDIFESVAAQGSDEDSGIRMYLYSRDGDTADLLRVADDTHLGPWIRMAALFQLKDDTQHDDAIRQAYDGIIGQYPSYGLAYEYYLEFLGTRGDQVGKARVAKLWLLNQPVDKSVFDFWKATDALAEAQLAQGTPDQAWTTILPALFKSGLAPAQGTPPELWDSTGYGPAMEVGTRIELARQDIGMAQSIAALEAEIYPDSLSSQTDQLRVWWHTGDYAKAAALLGGWSHPSADWQWRSTLGKPFAEQLGGDPAKAVQAITALAAAKVQGQKLFDLMNAVADAGHPQTAFALTQQLNGDGINQLGDALESYALLKKYESPAESEAWLMPKLPPGRRDEQSMYYYYSHLYELLWDAIPDPAQAQYPDQIWLLRAAAAAQGAPLTDDERGKLEAYLQSNSAQWYPTLARYVMGHDDGHSFLSSAMNPHQLSEAAYYLALRAMAQGRYKQGLEWLNVELDTGQLNNGEWHMGQELLVLWNHSGKSLKWLAGQGKLYDYPT